MAKVTLGPNVTDIRGSLGTSVYARNHQGLYVRTRKTPINRNTITQYQIRQWLKATGNAWWATLTQTQRAGWAALAARQRYSNSIADKYAPTPQNFYASRNMDSLIAGGTAIATAPSDVQLTDPGPIALSASSSGQTVTLTPTNGLPGGYGAIVRASTGISPGFINLNKYLHALLFKANPAFTDTFGGTHPVPPWTAQSGYAAADWNNAANVLTQTAIAGPQYISAGVNIANIRFTFSWQYPVAGTYPLIAAIRVNTSTGAGYYLAPQSGVGYMTLYAGTGWATPTATQIAVGAGGLTAGYWDPIQFDMYDTHLTVTVQGVTILAVNTATYTTGDCVLALKTAASMYKAAQVSTLQQTPPVLPNIGPWWTTKYGTLIAGTQIGVLLRYVNLSTGQATPPRTASCIVS